MINDESLGAWHSGNLVCGLDLLIVRNDKRHLTLDYRHPVRNLLF